jgi:hypothetical protein
MVNMSFRELGNEHFKAGQYKEAEQLYTEAHVYAANVGHESTNMLPLVSQSTPDPTQKSSRIDHSREFAYRIGLAPNLMPEKPLSFMGLRKIRMPL